MESLVRSKDKQLAKMKIKDSRWRYKNANTSFCGIDDVTWLCDSQSSKATIKSCSWNDMIQIK